MYADLLALADLIIIVHVNEAACHPNQNINTVRTYMYNTQMVYIRKDVWTAFSTYWLLCNKCYLLAVIIVQALFRDYVHTSLLLLLLLSLAFS